VWMMELNLGVSAVLLKGYFGGVVLWFVAGARVVDVWAGRHHSSGMCAGTVRVTCNADGPKQWSLGVSLPLPFALFAILCIGVTIPSSSHQNPPFRFPADPGRRRLLTCSVPPALAMVCWCLFWCISVCRASPAQFT
jgi:hypothetical protein